MEVHSQETGGTECACHTFDLIIFNASIHTMNAQDTCAQAVGIANGVIKLVGQNEEVLARAKQDAVIIDAKGGTLVPGYIDAHTHPLLGTIPLVFEIPLTNAVGKEEILQTIADFVKKHPELPIYAGLGYARAYFDEIGPRKEWLDEICSDKPIILTALEGHSVWLNSKALSMLAVGGKIKEITGAQVVYDLESGQPTGLIRGPHVSDLVAPIMPKYSKDDYKRAIRYFQEWFNSEGITATCDAFMDANESQIIEAYEEMAEAGELTMRFRGAWYVNPGLGLWEGLMKYIERAEKISTNLKTPLFQVQAIKIMGDGNVEEETAYMLEPYQNHADGYRGKPIWPEEILKELVLRLDARGWQLHVLLVGRGVAAETLNAFEAAAKQNGTRDSRHTFAHMQFIRDEDLQRMHQLGMVGIVAPQWCAIYPETYMDVYIPRVGKVQADNTYRLRAMLDAGLTLAMHTDFYTTDPDMGELFYMGQTRSMTRKGFAKYYGSEYRRSLDIAEEPGRCVATPLPPHDQGLTLNELVKISTQNGAYAHFLETEVGSIEPGKYADLVLYDTDVYSLSLDDVAVIKPRMTIFNGKIVYNRGITKRSLS